ncbi:MAG: sugar-binding transcriptional regulator [Anaerolineaceae bacterium]|nr:sugar-binding transcriptional regulator [Anaerolineaceae bacterium]NTV35534.1 sugar-binding transcriptional regulator [Anaerolineaceae bacterium]
MSEQRSERAELLADVAEMYYLKEETQAAISKQVGVTRSMVSRMLNEARQMGIVEININRPLTFDLELQAALEERFGIKFSFVIKVSSYDPEVLVQRLGVAGAFFLSTQLRPGLILGLPWGTTVAAIVDNLKVEIEVAVKVVQLVGALGSRNLKYDGHTVVQRLAQKLGGEAYYLNAPFLVDNKTVVDALINSPTVRDTLKMAENCDLALLGIGSTDLEYSTYFNAGYLTYDEVVALQKTGAIGGVCGVHYDLQGRVCAKDFQKRMITIDETALHKIPERVGVAGGPGKVAPLLGALRSKLINAVITDTSTARELLKLDASS